MRVDLLRLMAFREIRLRLLLVYLVLPIAFLFIEVFPRVAPDVAAALEALACAHVPPW